MNQVSVNPTNGIGPTQGQRKTLTRVGIESYSTVGHEGHGVPQGSILGPTLFNIYINDLPGIPRVCSVESYVDDSKLYLTFPLKEAFTAMAQLSEDLKISLPGVVQTVF